MLKNVRDLLPDFAPSQVIADFEEASRAAVRAVFGVTCLNRHVDFTSLKPSGLSAIKYEY